MLLALLVSAALTAVVVFVGLRWVLPEDSPTPAPEPLATPLADIDTAAVTVMRGEFCDHLDEDDIAAAVAPEGLEGELTAASYGDGDVARVSERVRDVAHEYSCTWTADDARSARAWVFTPPVTRQQARALARSTLAGTGCEPVAGVPGLGQPTVTTSCRTDRQHTTVTMRGLLGDAWLSCSVTGTRAEPPADLVDRTGRWCVAVMQATAPRTDPE